jgi:hypothetical protein
MKKMTLSISLMSLLMTSAAYAAPADTPPVQGDNAVKAAPDERPPYDHKPRRFNLEDCDKNKDGALDMGEFSNCFPKGAKERFAQMDADKDDKVSKEELRAWREARKAKRHEERLLRRQEEFARCDVNNDGVLSKEEFVNCAKPRHDGKGPRPGGPHRHEGPDDKK